MFSVITFLIGLTLAGFITWNKEKILEYFTKVKEFFIK